MFAFRRKILSQVQARGQTFIRGFADAIQEQNSCICPGDTV